MLTALLLIPLIAAVLVLFSPRANRALPHQIATAATLVTFVLGLALFLQFDSAATGLQFETKVPWVTSLGLNYHVGLDGLNVGLVLMGTLVAFAASALSGNIQRSEKEFFSLLLVMIAGIFGAFISQDLFFFYFFHELALVPTFLMIGVWGRGDRRTYATFQITIYLTLGALIALAGLILLYVKQPAGSRSFSFAEMTAYFQANPLTASDQHLIFGLLLFGFGILVSLWPFHSWAPLGYGSAPTGNAMLHAGVLKKFGLYGLLRIALPMLPQGAHDWLPVLATLCLGNLLYCGWVAMRQRDLNMLIGNSSVAHMGFCFLGIASVSVVGITGTVVIMVAHGLLAALSYALSGYLDSKAGTLDMDRFGGLLRQLPFIGTALVIAMFAGCGLPGFANFAGELLVMFGAWKSAGFSQWIVVAAAWGALIIGGVYMLRAIRSLLHGPMPAVWSTLPDATGAQKLPYALLIAALLIFGVAPGLLVNQIRPSAERIVQLATSGKVKAPDAPVAPAAKVAHSH